jgi:flagellar hook-basal body complex protein FliE
MIAPISNAPIPTDSSAAASKADGGGFSAALESVRATMTEAHAKSSEAMVGGGSIHTAMIAMTKADLSFRFAAQVRNKAVEAYREMMNLQF